MRKNHKALVNNCLRNRNWKELISWEEKEGRAIRVVSSYLLSSDLLTRWRAIEAIGKLCGYRDHEGDREAARKTILRLMWVMNDESGSIIWSAPETLAEILFNVPPLIKKFAPILVSNIDLEPFPQGVHWGISRVSEIRPEIFNDSVDLLIESLQADDPYIRAFAARALGNMKSNATSEKLESMVDDDEMFEFYDMDSGDFRGVEVSQFCRAALDKIR